MTMRAAPRRSPRDGGYAPGGEARARIIEAALQIFADEGYERASTRQIAAAAAVNPPAVQYYFESKGGLHAACAEFMAERVTERLRSSYAVADEALASGGEGAAADALVGLLDALLSLSLESNPSPSWSRFLVRTQADRAGAGYPLARDRIHGPLFRKCAALAATATGAKPADEGPKLMALLLLNQLSAFSTHRDSTLAALEWLNLDRGRSQMLRTALRRATFGVLASPAI
jgi:TetR/AcrR family transcriptional regulator, regulator of cefoperazone and chloramphenicol sensitivity